MRSVLLSVAVLVLSFSLLVAGNSLQFVALGQRAAIEGFSTLSMGLINTAYFVGFAIGSLYISRLIDIIGHIRTFAAMASMVSGLVLAHAIVPDPIAWAAMRLFSGLCFVGLYAVVESWLNARATNDIRGRLMSTYGVLVSLGFSGGPLLANLVPNDGMFVFLVSSILISFALVPVTTTRASAPVPESATDSGGEISLLRLYRETPLGVVGIGLTGLVQAAFLATAPLFGAALGLQTDRLTLLISLSLMAGMVAQFPLGWLSDRFDRRLTIVAVACGGTVSGLFLASVGSGAESVGTLFLYGACMAVCACIFPLYSILGAYINDWIPSNALVQAAGAIQLSYGIGSMVGPVAGALAMEQAGPFGLFMVIGGVMALLAAFAIYRTFRRDPVAAADQTDFVPMAPNPAFLAVDPRVEDAQISFDFATDRETDR